MRVTPDFSPQIESEYSVHENIQELKIFNRNKFIASSPSEPIRNFHFQHLVFPNNIFSTTFYIKLPDDHLDILKFIGKSYPK
jgi:hypothetical protein